MISCAFTGNRAFKQFVGAIFGVNPRLLHSFMLDLFLSISLSLCLSLSASYLTSGSPCDRCYIGKLNASVIDIPFSSIDIRTRSIARAFSVLGVDY